MTRNRDLGPLAAAGAVVVTCAACCAGPLLAFLAAAGVSSAIAAWRVPLLAIGAGVTVGAALPIEHRSIAAQASDPDVAIDALGIDVLAADHTGLTSIFTPQATSAPEEPS